MGRRPRNLAAGTPAASAGAAGATGRGQGQQRPQRSAVARVSGRLAGEQIRRLAERCDDLDNRGQLRQLARQIERDCGGRRRSAACAATISGCLDGVTSPGDAWLVRAAATWAVARLVRQRRAAGGTGPIVERLSVLARQATDGVTAGDTAAAEFVLVLSRLFADLEACRLLEQDVRAALVEEIDRLVSPDGSVRLADSAAMIDRVVRWTAVREAALATGGPVWPSGSVALPSASAAVAPVASTEDRWTAAARAALRMLGGQGRILTATGRRPVGHSAVLVATLAAKGGRGAGKPARRTVRVLVADTTSRLKPRGSGRRPGRLLPRAIHDPDAAVAVMRSDWTGDGIRVLLDYRDAAPHLEIAVADRLLVHGPWQWAVTVDGRLREPRGPWTVSCWETDRRATFLEITAPLGDGRQLERQVVLLPRDRIVVLADAVTFAGPEVDVSPPGHEEGNGHAPTGALDYRGIVPLAAALETEAAEETREVFLYDATMRCLALPLALPEWRGVGRGGFESTPAGLAVSQFGRHRLYAPVWIDCDAARIGGALTWRQLTVADTRIILPPHQAAGFRVQAGDEQWLLYKTLDAPRNRTLLGCNVSCDFLVGRLKRSGEVARTLEIQ